MVEPSNVEIIPASEMGLDIPFMPRMNPPDEPTVHAAVVHRNKIIETARRYALDGEANLRDAIEWIEILQPAKRHLDLLTQVRQLVEEIEGLA